MPQNAIVSLIENIIILLIFSVIFDFYWIKYRETKRKLMNYATGILIGMIGICLVVKDLQWFNYIKIDSRTVLLSLVGLFFGTVPTIIATAMILIFRILYYSDTWQVLVLESVYTILAGASGLIFKYITPNWKNKNWLRTLCHTAILPHAIMFACLSLMPNELTSNILSETAWVIWIVFPASSILLGRLIMEQSNRWDLKQQLKVSDARFNQVAICSDDIFWEINPQGVITYASDTIFNILGYSKEEVVGKSPRILIGDFESINSLVEYAANAANSDEPYNKTLVFKHKNGNRVICNARGLKSIDEYGKMKGFIGVVHDITQSKQQHEQMVHSQKLLLEQNRKYAQLNKELEETNNKIIDYNIKLQELNKRVEKADKAKLAFIAQVSNEIKRPLSDINNRLSLIMESHISDDEKHSLMIQAQQNSNFIINIANDIIDCDRLNCGVMKFQFNVVNIDDIFNGLQNYYNTQNLYITKKPIILSKNQELVDGNQVIKTDNIRLKQILGNLIANAYKFTNTGKIEIGCKKFKEDTLLFSVSDTGIGISEEIYDKIFSPYNTREPHFIKQAETETTGLGLYICKEIVNKMGGNIWFNSEVGKGTTFYFTLPYVRASEIAIKNVINYDWSNKKALIIGANKFNIVLVSETIAKTNIKYKAVAINDLVENGAATTEYFQHFDIILIEKDLLELKKTQRFITNYPQTPILLLDTQIDPATICEQIKNKME